MTLKKIISRMKQYRPQFADEFEQMIGPTLNEIGSGCFREVFHIEGTNVVIKFPMQEDNTRWSINHSRREIRRIKQIARNEKYRHVRRYVPKTYYYDYQNGVLIMQRLLDLKISKEVCKPITDMFKDTFFCISDQPDVYGNVGYDGRGQIKLLDWGCV